MKQLEWQKNMVALKTQISQVQQKGCEMCGGPHLPIQREPHLTIQGRVELLNYITNKDGRQQRNHHSDN